MPPPRLRSAADGRVRYWARARGAVGAHLWVAQPRQRHDGIEARLDEAVEAGGRSSAPRVPRGGDALAPPYEWPEHT